MRMRKWEVSMTKVWLWMGILSMLMEQMRARVDVILLILGSCEMLTMMLMRMLMMQKACQEWMRKVAIDMGWSLGVMLTMKGESY